MKASRWKRECILFPAKPLPRCWRSWTARRITGGTSLEGLDAFQRQLKRYDIKVSGEGSDPVERFFASAGSAALFPEYIARAVRQGMERMSKVTDLVAAVTNIDGLDYRTINPEGGDWQAAAVAEGAQLPTATLRTSSGLVKLYKRDRCFPALTRRCAFSGWICSPWLWPRLARALPRPR